MKKSLLTYEEFMRDAQPTNALRLSEEDIRVLDEAQQESDLRRDRAWSYLADKIVGSE